MIGIFSFENFDLRNKQSIWYDLSILVYYLVYVMIAYVYSYQWWRHGGGGGTASLLLTGPNHLIKYSVCVCGNSIIIIMWQLQVKNEMWANLISHNSRMLY